MLGALGEIRQPAAEDGHRGVYCVLSRWPAEPGRPAEHADERDAGRVGYHELRRISEPDPVILAPAAGHSLREVARDAAAGRDVRIGGGPTMMRAFIAAGLVDHLHRQTLEQEPGVVADQRG